MKCWIGDCHAEGVADWHHDDGGDWATATLCERCLGVQVDRVILRWDFTLASRVGEGSVSEKFPYQCEGRR